MSAYLTPAVGAGPGEHTAAARRGGSWRWLGRRGSLARRLLLSYGVVVLVDVAVFVSTGLYMTPTRLHGTPRDSAYQDAVFANQLEAVVVAALISLIVGTVTAALLPRLLLDPLRQLRRSTRSLMEGRYTDSVPEPRLPELSDLAQDVNVLAARLADLEVRRARLVSDVAHELRTPLTIIDGQMAGVEDGVYSLDSDLIASIREELDRLHRLTEDLSGLSRAEESAYELHRARTDLAALSEDVTSRLRPQFTTPASSCATARAARPTPTRTPTASRRSWPTCSAMRWPPHHPAAGSPSPPAAPAIRPPLRSPTPAGASPPPTWSESSSDSNACQAATSGVAPTGPAAGSGSPSPAAWPAPTVANSPPPLAGSAGGQP